MTGDGLRQAAIEMFGERGWVSALAGALGVDPSMIWRYVNNRTPVPGPVEAAVACWQRRFKETGERPSRTPRGEIE